MAASPTRKRRAARARRQGPQQLPWRRVENPFPPMEVLSADQLEHIHEASLTVLEELGMEVLGAEARRIYREAGARVDEGTKRVRLDRALVMERMASAPSQFTLYSRAEGRHIALGGNRIAMAAVSSPPNCSDLDGGRRVGSFADFRALVRVAASLNCVHLFAGYPVEPVDLPVSTHHLDCYMTFIADSDRVWRTYALGAQRSRDGIEMNRIARGISADEMREKPGLITLINTNSPLRLDEPMSQGLIEMARAGQAVAITPFTLLGAMAPSTLAGALAQQNAEALAGLVLVQLVRPGNPSLYGGFTSNVDMKSGAPAFGTPEYARAALAGGQLARLNGLPYRSSNANASNAVDAQAGWESAMYLESRSFDLFTQASHQFTYCALLLAFQSPRGKLHCVVQSCKILISLLQYAKCGDPPGADDLFPVLVYTLIKANPPSLLSTIQYVRNFAEARLVGEDAYWWAQFSTAVEFTKTLE